MFYLNVEYVYCVIFSELFCQYCNFRKPLLVEVPQIPPRVTLQLQSNPFKLPSEISPTNRLNPTSEIKQNSEITSSTSVIEKEVRSSVQVRSSQPSPRHLLHPADHSHSQEVL